MTLDDYLLFLPAYFALNMAFGPNHLLSLSNGARDGTLRAAASASACPAGRRDRPPFRQRRISISRPE